MATGDIPDFKNVASTETHSLPKLSLFTMFRLGLFQMGLGIMAILTSGVLNRILITELAVSATLVSVALSMDRFVSPARVWFGQLSDARPIRGFHRSGYVWIGTALFVTLSFVAAQVIWPLGAANAAGDSGAFYGWGLALGVVFALYGFCLSASSTPFAALLVDISDEEDRSKLVGVVWSMLTVGIVLGAIISGALLEGTTPENLQASVNRLFIIIPILVMGLCLLSTVGVEKKYSRYSSRSSLSSREERVTIGTAMRVLTASRQTGLFFTFLLVMTISLFMQELVLEPYGGEVFGMAIAETTRLNAFWGLGTLVGLSGSGFLITPRLGKKRTTRLGCLLVAGCFVLVILSGFTQAPFLLQIALFLLGLGFGVVTNGSISLMLDLTAPETAGTFIGAWGLSQAMARGVAGVLGGTTLDIGRQIFPQQLVLAFGLVFALQAIGMLVAIALLSRVNVDEFRTTTKQAITTVLENELE